jgi:hypothetical protein
VTEQTETTQFHDCEDGDIFDLYNACDGQLENGLLDIRQLDEFSEEERAQLNVTKLTEIWIHTASGCSQCGGIVQILNSVRGALGVEVAAFAEPAYDLSTNYALED